MCVSDWWDFVLCEATKQFQLCLTPVGASERERSEVRCEDSVCFINGCFTARSTWGVWHQTLSQHHGGPLAGTSEQQPDHTHTHRKLIKTCERCCWGKEIWPILIFHKVTQVFFKVNVGKTLWFRKDEVWNAVRACTWRRVWLPWAVGWWCSPSSSGCWWTRRASSATPRTLPAPSPRTAWRRHAGKFKTFVNRNKKRGKTCSEAEGKCLLPS